MQASKDGKCLWDNAKFSKLSSPAERLTGVFAEKLVVQAGIPQYPLTEPLVVLDNACGTGVVTKALQEILSDRSADSFEITCGDLADAMLDATARRIKSTGWINTKTQKVDAQDTKLPSNHYTHILTNFGPMLFPDASSYLTECHRMLRSRGVCAFTTWKKVGWLDDFREAVGSISGLPPFPSDEKIASAFSRGGWDNHAYIQEQLAQHGFKNVQVQAEQNTSVFNNWEDFEEVFLPIIAIIFRFWTQEEQDEFANKGTEDRIREWFQQRYSNNPVSWDWIALVSTSSKL